MVVGVADPRSAADRKLFDRLLPEPAKSANVLKYKQLRTYNSHYADLTLRLDN